MVGIPSSGNGRYTVTWRALSDDSHIVTGAFSYAVGGAGAQAAAGDHGHMHTDHSGGDHQGAAGHSDADHHDGAGYSEPH